MTPSWTSQSEIQVFEDSDGLFEMNIDKETESESSFTSYSATSSNDSGP